MIEEALGGILVAIEVPSVKVHLFDGDAMDYYFKFRLTTYCESFICLSPVDLPEVVCFLFCFAGESDVVALQNSKSSNLNQRARGCCFLICELFLASSDHVDGSLNEYFRWIAGCSWCVDHTACFYGFAGRSCQDWSAFAIEDQKIINLMKRVGSTIPLC